MAKFCNQCGTELIDGKCPKCKDIKENNKRKNIGQELLNILKNIWKNPIETIKEQTEKENLIISFILLGISIIVSGIFTYCYTDSIVHGIISTINNKMVGIASLLGESYTKTAPLITLPFFSIFLGGALTTALAYITFILLLNLFIGIVFKGKKSIKKYTQTIAIASIFPTAFTIVGILTSFISYTLTSFIYLIGLVIFIVIVVQSLIDILKANEEKLGYAVPLTIIFTYIVVIIIAITFLSIFVTTKNPYIY